LPPVWGTVGKKERPHGGKEGLRLIGLDAVARVWYFHELNKLVPDFGGCRHVSIPFPCSFVAT